MFDICVHALTTHSSQQITEELRDMAIRQHEIAPMADRLIHQVFRVDGLTTQEAARIRALAAPSGVFVTYSGDKDGDACSVLMGGTMVQYSLFVTALRSTSYDHLATSLSDHLEYTPTR